MKKPLIKSFLMILFLLLSAGVAYSQNSSFINQSNSDPQKVRPQSKYIFAPTTKYDFFGKNFMASLTGNNTAPNLLFTPGRYQSAAMMNVVNMYTTAGNLKFYTNYYSDANGALQDGAITLSKIRRPR